VDGFDSIAHTDLDNRVNIEILGDRSLGSVEFKGLIGLVTMLREAICIK
jgi:hypothetical protein